MAALFISDLHLDQARPAITRLFLGFLEERAGEAEALYILGDLFEVWIGDDDDEALGREVAAGLKRLAARTPVYLMHGNRDFLLGEGFEADSGVRLLPETEVIDLYGQPTLIMHGDTLCTDDLEYQAFRARVRSPQWLSQVLGLPLVQRRMMAKKLRADSQKAIQDKAAAITDVNQQTVMEVMREHGVRQLIHGHTHRPGIHEFPLDDKPARRVVLGDWYARGSVLYCDAAGCRLEALG